MKKSLILVFIPILISCTRYNNRVILDLEVNGVVKEKYIDKMNHYENTVKFYKSGELGLFEWEKANHLLFKNIQIGDSISKNHGEFSLFVYKKDGSVKEYKYRDRNGKVYNNKESL